MPQTEEKGTNDGSNNRVSNMPLLFADGYPTSLNKITEAQLEKFIPFMVQCSLGYIQIHSLDEFREPEWWPRDVEFTKPFKKPKSFTGNWLQTMREIVVVCYSFHDCIYLLRYCNDLASYQPTSLRFINNYNSTTSLYERTASKLLVTFRNENMLYDQEQKINSRKCLLPKLSSSQQHQASMDDMVISEGFDIYLCDNCDAELYSYGALVEHEKVCLKEQSNHSPDHPSDDDDVIFCGEVFDKQLPLGSSARARTEQQRKQDFLGQNFTLLCATSTDTAGCSVRSSPTKPKSGSAADLDSAPNEGPPNAGKHRRLPRRSRYVLTLARCPQIPLSSPLGQSMLKSTKGTCTPEYVSERLDRVERFCHAPTLPRGTAEFLRQRKGNQEVPLVPDRRLPKWLIGKPRPVVVPVTYKRPADEPIEYYREYKHPRRQFSSKRRIENFLFYNKPLIERCRPCKVRLKTLTPSEVRFLIEWPGVERRQREAEQAALEQRERRRQLAARAMIIDSIDLCSSDEEELGSESPYSVESPLTAFPIETNPCVQKRVAASSVNNQILSERSRDTGSNVGEDLGTIELESDDAEVVPGTGADRLDRRSVPSANHPRPPTANSAVGVSHPNGPIPATMLSESTLRLNQPLPTVVHANGTEAIENTLVRPVYLYTSCSGTTTVGVAGTAGTTIADAARLLKENRLSGWMQNGITHGVDGTGNSAPITMMTQPVLLATPNGRALLGTIPVAFGSGATGMQTHVGGASVVQTLTTSSTFVNQTVVHRPRLSVARPGGPTATVVTGATAANLQ